jgi:hypothetical protein
MTPQERQLIEQLFDRLATLENEPRDADAERAIREGLARAPNAVYALVQTALVQDEALRRANGRIEQLEAALGSEPPQQQGSFLDSLRNAMFGTEQRRGSGSVPTVRPGEMARPDDRWNQGQAMGVPPGYGRGPDPGWQGGPGMGPYGGGPAPGGGYGGGGGSFLGTAAAAAAGVIGGSLLLNSIRGMMGPAHAGQSAFDPGSGSGDRSPWGGGAADSDLSRQAGLKDIGGRRAGAYDDAQRDTDDRRDDSDRAADDSDDADYDDSDADYGDDTESV